MSKVSPTKPILVMLYGYPGAGKTHFARELSATMGAAHVHGDRIRGELFEEPRYDQQENEIVKHLMLYMTEEFLGAGLSVILMLVWPSSQTGENYATLLENPRPNHFWYGYK